VDLISYAFALKHKLQLASYKAIPLTSVGEFGIPVYGVYWIPVTLTDSRGTTRQYKRACLAVDRDHRDDGSPLLLSRGFLDDARIHLIPYRDHWYFDVHQSRLEMLPPKKFTKECRGHACVYAVILTHEEECPPLEEGDPGGTPPNPVRKEDVPECLWEFLEFFNTNSAAILPANKKTDHAIELLPGTDAPHMPIYPLTYAELQELQDFLKRMQAEKKIRPSKSPARAPILFVPKKDGTLRLCVDYRGLNKVTVKNRYTLPLISELLDRISGATVFSKVDLKDAYYRIRIKPGDEWKTAFGTRYGHFEFLVLPMGLTNAPATFQSYIHDALGQLLDICCIAYLDDVLIFSRTMEEHAEHLRRVIETLLNAGLYAKFSKCQFFKQDMEFLGYVISPTGIAMDPGRVDTIRQWPEPESCHDIQVFMGFCNFYRRFIDGFSRIAAPLFKLLTKTSSAGKRCGEPFLNPPALAAFLTLKEAFTKAPLLIHFDPEKHIKVETDASVNAGSGTLSQQDEQGRWHPVAFWSRKWSGAELNYSTPDQEMLAIVETFKHWRHYLQGTKHPVQVYSDHANLRSFMNLPRLNGRQARWCMTLAPFDFVILHQPGKRNPADPPSRRPDYTTNREDNLMLLPTLQRKLAVADALEQSNDKTPRVLAGEVFAARRPRERKVLAQAVGRRAARQAAEAEAPFEKPTAMLKDLIKQVQGNDPECRGIQERILHETPVEPQWSVSTDGLLLHEERVYIPSEKAIHYELIQLHHDDPLAGHFGITRTIELLERKFYWKDLRKDVREYINACAICLESKAKHHRPYGELQPLPIPSRPGEEYSMDLITGLPPAHYKSQEVNALLVIVDRFTKMAFLFPVEDTLTASQLAELFHNEIECKFGAPKGIVSDRGPIFTSKFWGELNYYSKVKLRYSTAFHPQTDGQTERMNQIIECYLRCYTGNNEVIWPKLLPQAFYAMNSAVNSTTGFSPFETLYGFKPEFRLFVEDHLTLKGVPAIQDRIQKLDSLRESLAEQWQTANEKYAAHYNKTHKPMSFKIGQAVMLTTRNLRLRYRKLAPKYIGPFRVIARVGSQAYRLALPDKYRQLHNVFPVAYLEPWTSEVMGLPMPDLEDDGEWEVEDVLGRTTFQGETYYEVKWAGWPSEYNQWVPRVDMDNAQQAIHAYEKRQKRKKKVHD
jgi:hypothetical protein